MGYLIFAENLMPIRTGSSVFYFTWYIQPNGSRYPIWALAYVWGDSNLDYHFVFNMVNIRKASCYYKVLLHTHCIVRQKELYLLIKGTTAVDKNLLPYLLAMRITIVSVKDGLNWILWYIMNKEERYVMAVPGDRGVRLGSYSPYWGYSIGSGYFAKSRQNRLRFYIRLLMFQMGNPTPSIIMAELSTLRGRQLTVGQAIMQIDRVIMLALSTAPYRAAPDIWDAIQGFSKMMYRLGRPLEELVVDEHRGHEDLAGRGMLCNWKQWKHQIRRDLGRGLRVPEDIPRAIDDIKDALWRWDLLKDYIEEWAHMGERIVHAIDNRYFLDPQRPRRGRLFLE